MLYVIANCSFFDLTKVKKRGFKNIDEMNNQMLKAWNETVKPDDTVLCLGKLFQPVEIDKIKNLCTQLNGDIIVLTEDYLIREYYQQNQLSDYFYIFSTKDYYDHIDVLFCPFCDNPESKKDKYTVCCCGSGHNFNDMCKDKYLNVDADKWEYYPIVASEVKNIYNNMSEFFEEESNEVH